MHKRLVFRLPVLLLAVLPVLLLQGCIANMTEMRADINNLKQDSFETKKDISSLKRTQDALKQDVGTLKGQPVGVAGDDSLAAIRTSQADLYSQVSETLNEMQQLSGRVDERSYSVDKQLQQLNAEMELVKSRIDSLQGDSARRTPSGATGTVPRDIQERLSQIEADIVFIKAKLSALEAHRGGAPEVAGGAPEASPEEEYKKAYALYKEEKYQESRAAMQKFMEAFPKHSLAGNAQFWIGETYYNEHDYASAILAYEEVLKKYKNNRKVPAAMLKQGFAFSHMGENEAARAILRDVVAKYPGTDIAEAAKKKLDAIK